MFKTRIYVTLFFAVHKKVIIWNHNFQVTIKVNMKTNFSKFCNLKLELKNGTKFWLKFRTWRVISQFIPIKKLERKGNSFFFNADTYDLLLTYPAANFSVFFPSAKKKNQTTFVVFLVYFAHRAITNNAFDECLG